MGAKRVAVLSGGNGGHMMAADMKLKGHEVRLYEMPRFRQNVEMLFDTKTITVTGVISEKVTLDMVTDDIDKAIDGAQYILLTTPAFAHPDYAKLLAGKVKKDQIIVVFPGALATLLLRKEFGDKNCPVIAEANNLPFSVRIIAPCKLHLSGFNKINISFFPASAGAELVEEMRADLFNFEKVYQDILECSLSLVNPALHSGPCVINVSNIERPDVNFYIYEHGFTPSAAKLDIALDNERKAVGKKLGYNITSMEDFGNLKEGYTWQELYQAVHGSIYLTPICGPNDVFNRYFTEDAPYGLVPWSSIGRQIGVEMPVTDAIINIYNIIHGTDWREAGNTAEKLGLAGKNAEQISDYVKNAQKE